MKKYKVTVSGKTYEVEVEELDLVQASVAHAPVVSQVTTPAPAPVSAPPPAPPPVPPPATSVQAEMTAPIPGKIFKIIANPGDTVKTGDILLVIEAMKMENEITAEADGKIADIPVKEGDNVSAGDVLVRFE